MQIDGLAVISAVGCLEVWVKINESKTMRNFCPSGFFVGPCKRGEKLLVSRYNRHRQTWNFAANETSNSIIF